MENLEHMASDEFSYYYEKDGFKYDRKIQPTLQCFCLKQAELDDERDDTNMSER